MGKRDHIPKSLSLSAKIRSASSISEEDILKSKVVKDKHKVKPGSRLSEEDILKSGEKKQKPESVPEPQQPEEIKEEDITRAGVIRDKNKKLNKDIPVPVPEMESDPTPKKKFKEITDAQERKVAKRKIPSNLFVQEFAKALGCKTATEVLGSDVSFWYPFDCAPLDIIFGGGVPSGKVIECFGWESSGKSTITLEAAKAFIKYWVSMNNDNYVVLWLESESALDKVRAQYMGCDLSRFVVQEVETTEEGFKIIKAALEKAKDKNLHVFIAWDTIAAVLTDKEKTSGESNTGGMGEKARLIRSLLKDVSTLLGQTNSTLVFVNQMYKNFAPYGEKDEVPGGGGIKFHASIRCLMKRVGPPIEVILPNGNKITKGIEVELYTKKNKLTLPYQTCRMVINGESGLDKVETLARFLVMHKYIVVKGGWKYIEFGDNEYKFQNTEQLKEILEVKCPELKTYMNYLCYNLFASISPLLKVKLLGKLWEFEIQLYGERKTKITEEEFALATLLGRELLEEQDRIV